jgi:RNA polymerase primary sigma factor
MEELFENCGAGALDPPARPNQPDDLLRLYLQEITSLAAKAKAQGDEDKSRRLEAHLPLVVAIARRFNRPTNHLRLLDLIQEGNLALMQAVESYDESEPRCPFIAHAYQQIRYRIWQAIAEKNRTVRLTRHIAAYLPQLRRAARSIAREFGRRATPAEIAEKMGLPLDKVQRLLIIDMEPLSLDIPFNGEGPLADFIEDDKIPSPFEAAASRNVTDQLFILTPREQEMVRMRFGIGEHTEHSIAELAAHLGFCREYVGEILSQALSKLRHHCLQGFY